MSWIMTRSQSVAVAIGLLLPNLAWADDADSVKAINEALTLSASFDSGLDAEFAKGDKQIYIAPTIQRVDPKPGLAPGEVEIAKGQGRNGSDALRFIKKSDKIVFFKGAENVDYRPQNWSGTASFWLRLDPQTDLGNWYCDPIQITEKAWNDAAIWIDFSKDERPKHFRLGALADLKVWNPTNRDFERMTAAERPMVVAPKAPFSQTTWTHVVVTFENFNSGKPDGVAKLYVNGELQGTISGRTQTYTWDTEKVAIMIGIGYVGFYDDLAVYNRVLSQAEIGMLRTLESRLSVDK